MRGLRKGAVKLGVRRGQGLAEVGDEIRGTLFIIRYFTPRVVPTSLKKERQLGVGVE
jgi:hypothetical protein